MNRRTFLKLSGAAVLCLALPKATESNDSPSGYFSQTLIWSQVGPILLPDLTYIYDQRHNYFVPRVQRLHR